MCDEELYLRKRRVRAPKAPAEDVMLASDESTGRVLVVEDDEAIADVLRRTLRQEGHEVRSAGDGVAALALAEEFVPDLVILDLGLPKLDGSEVLRRLRNESDV